MDRFQWTICSVKSCEIPGSSNRSSDQLNVRTCLSTKAACRHSDDRHGQYQIFFHGGCCFNEYSVCARSGTLMARSNKTINILFIVVCFSETLN